MITKEKSFIPQLSTNAGLATTDFEKAETLAENFEKYL